MRTVSVLLGTLLLAVGCLAQGERSRITPTPDPDAPSKVYIPKDLEDAFVELKKMLSPALLNDEFGYTTFPQVFVISRDGRIVKRVRGFDPQKDPAVLREAIEQALGQS